MPTLPQGPKLLKGAIVHIDLRSGKQTPIIFQYNPSTLTRSYRPPQAEPSGEEGQRTQKPSYKSAPQETISLEVEIDAADQLEHGDPLTQAVGIYPQLAVLEMLLYPASQDVVQNDRTARKGSIGVASPYEAPFTLFVWGAQRVLPVIVVDMSITEDVFDAMLNPIQATAKLSLRALSYSDLTPAHKGYDYFLTYQKAKEQVARAAAGKRVASALGQAILI